MAHHLSDIELVDLLDGALPPSRAAHLDDCARCRMDAERLREDTDRLRDSAMGDVPEPSPLFWEHFSQRVHDAVHDAEPVAPRTPGWFRAPLAGWTVAIAGVILAAGIAFWAVTSRSAAPTPTGSLATDQTLPPADETPLDLDGDEDWALVRAVAEDLQWDDAHEAGLSARPGSAERVALEMSAAERQELARLIEDEIKRTGA